MQHTNKNKKKSKLYALTSMQTNNQNRKHEATLSPSLDKAFLVKVRKSREGEGKTKKNNLTRLGAKCTEAMASSQTRHMKHQPLITTSRLSPSN